MRGLIRRDPSTTYSIGDLFDDCFRGTDWIREIFSEPLPSEKKMVPRINILEENGSVIVEASLPGFNEEQIQLEIKDGYLVLSGEDSKGEEGKEDGTYFRRELVRSSFSRTIELPDGVDLEKAEAKLKDGILRVILPKTEKREPKVQKIPIRSN